jgi:lipopolysaccharide export system permease protein
MQLMPPVVLCGLCAALLTLAASTVGVPWGNSAFKSLSFSVLKQNAAATVREKVFWDDIPGIVMYTDHYDEENHTLKGVIIYDGRDQTRPLTIFAADGVIGGGVNRDDMRLVLNNGSIHAVGTADEYRLVHFGEYIMTIGGSGQGSGFGTSELDMTVAELRRQIDSPSATKPVRLKMQSEFHSRFAFPFASLVFAVVAVPLGMQNRRSGKSAGFSTSIGVLLAYYVVQSLLRSLGERGSLPPALAMWLPNMIFLGLGWYLLYMASQERDLRFSLPIDVLRRKRKVD